MKTQQHSCPVQHKRPFFLLYSVLILTFLSTSCNWPAFSFTLSCFLFSLVIFGYLTWLNDVYVRQRGMQREWASWKYKTFLSFLFFWSHVLASSFLSSSASLYDSERHSLPSPPKEPHVFGQSGGAMHGCMPFIRTRLMPCTFFLS